MKQLSELTDQDALKVSEILGGASHLSKEGQIHQCKELIATNNLYKQQTNIPGIKWYRALKYLESKGYQIDESEQPAPSPIPGEEVDMTVKEFFSGFNLDFMSEEERGTIYTASELFALGKTRAAQSIIDSLTDRLNKIHYQCDIGVYDQTEVALIRELSYLPEQNQFDKTKK